MYSSSVFLVQPQGVGEPKYRLFYTLTPVPKPEDSAGMAEGVVYGGGYVVSFQSVHSHVSPAGASLTPSRRQPGAVETVHRPPFASEQKTERKRGLRQLRTPSKFAITLSARGSSGRLRYDCSQSPLTSRGGGPR